MKRIVLFLIVLTVSMSGFADFRSITIKDSLLQKKTTWDRTKLWVVRDMDKYNARISYQDYDTGIMIIKGKYKSSDDGLYSEREGLLTFYVDYEIEIHCNDGEYYAKYNDINCCVNVGYASFSYMSDFMLEIIKQELAAMKEIMSEKGEEFDIDDYFESEYDNISALVDEAETKKDDKNLKKSERRKYKKYYENNHWKPMVYSHIISIGFQLCYNTFYGGFRGEFNGLRDFIKQ